MTGTITLRMRTAGLGLPSLGPDGKVVSQTTPSSEQDSLAIRLPAGRGTHCTSQSPPVRQDFARSTGRAETRPGAGEDATTVSIGPDGDPRALGESSANSTEIRRILVMGKGVLVAGADRTEAQGPKQEHLGVASGSATSHPISSDVQTPALDRDFGLPVRLGGNRAQKPEHKRRAFENDIIQYPSLALQACRKRRPQHHLHLDADAGQPRAS